MVLYLIRHAESYEKSSKNHSLTQLGKYQAQSLGKIFENVPIEKIICSDLERCIETLNYAVFDRKITTYTTPLVREINRYTIGCPFEKPIAKTTLTKERERLEEATKTIESEAKKDGNILIISHGNFISYFAGHFLRLNTSERWRLMIWHSSVTKVTNIGEDYLLQYINSTSHLKETEFSRDPGFTDGSI